MNAPAQICAAAPFDLNAAHMEAHKWVEIARPLIKAYLALDQIQADVLAASQDAGVYRYTISRNADAIGKAVSELRSGIESVRDDVLADLSPPSPNWGRSMHESSPEAIAYDDLCDMWAERCRDVASVDSAIDREARS